MKFLYRFLTLFLLLSINNPVFGQKEKPKKNTVQQQPKAKPKVHANSNSVYIKGNKPPVEDKKNQPKKEEVKRETKGKVKNKK